MVLMHPDKFRELLEMMSDAWDGVDGTTRKLDGSKYEGVEFG